jgi:hypothetical protein
MFKEVLRIPSCRLSPLLLVFWLQNNVWELPTLRAGSTLDVDVVPNGEGGRRSRISTRGAVGIGIVSAAVIMSTAGGLYSCGIQFTHSTWKAPGLVTQPLIPEMRVSGFEILLSTLSLKAPGFNPWALKCDILLSNGSTCVLLRRGAGRLALLLLLLRGARRGLYKLNPIQLLTHSLKPPGFNPWACKVISWFQEICLQMQLVSLQHGSRKAVISRRNTGAGGGEGGAGIGWGIAGSARRFYRHLVGGMLLRSVAAGCASKSSRLSSSSCLGGWHWKQFYLEAQSVNEQKSDFSRFHWFNVVY